MKKLTICSLFFIGLLCWFYPVIAHEKIVVLPLNGSSSSSIIGSWWLDEAPQPDDIAVLTFFDDTHYFFGQYGDSTPSGDPNGQDGMEHGTYNWNSSTGIVTFSVTRDDNGEWGFSHNQGTAYITVNGSTLTFTDDSGTVVLYRVTQ